MDLHKEKFKTHLTNVQPFNNIVPENRSAGFVYLHSVLTKAVFDGKLTKINNIKFDKFTINDLDDYMRYYQNEVAKHLTVMQTFIDALNKASAVFSSDRRYY